MRRGIFMILVASGASFSQGFMARPSMPKARSHSVAMRAEQGQDIMHKIAQGVRLPLVLLPLLAGIPPSSAASSSWSARPESITVAMTGSADVKGAVNKAASDLQDQAEGAINKAGNAASAFKTKAEGAKDWIEKNDNQVAKAPKGFWSRLTNKNKIPDLADTEETAKSAVQKKAPWGSAKGQVASFGNDAQQGVQGLADKVKSDVNSVADAAKNLGGRDAGDKVREDVASTASAAKNLGRKGADKVKSDVAQTTNMADSTGPVQGLKDKDIRRLKEQEAGSGFGQAKSPAEGLTAKDVGKIDSNQQWQDVSSTGGSDVNNAASKGVRF